ncbi:uncharacterized protein LOC121714056 isoform X6 [Alosa sapidissima]|nr:uncharacterized protein LOC121714056 isoform X6 [Alosa sapidissima]XP_041955144.1 uncharacterized protein LOC121714056 isoform X6 [Alosa sapidissima]
MCLQKKGLCFLCAYDCDVVQVDNADEVVVVEKGTNTQMEADTTEEEVADGGLAQESAAAEGEQDQPVGEHACADGGLESAATEGEQVLFEVESVLRISDGTKAKRGMCDPFRGSELPGSKVPAHHHNQPVLSGGG